MPLVEIIHFSVELLLDSHAPHTTVDDTIQNVAKVLNGVKIPPNFALGTQVQDKGTVQITSEWDGVQDYANIEATPGYGSFINSVRNFCGKPDDIFHIALNRSAFGPEGAAAAPIVEFVLNYFQRRVSHRSSRSKSKRILYGLTASTVRARKEISAGRLAGC